MKSSGIFVALTLALTAIFYLLTYYFLPPPPSPALTGLFAAIAVGVVWSVKALLQSRRKRSRASKSTRNVHRLLLLSALACNAAALHIAHAQTAPLRMSCTVNPAEILPGGSATVTVQADSPLNRPLTYSYSATNGSVSGPTASATFSIMGTQLGVITITCLVADDLGNRATANTTVTVLAPPPPAPPPPETGGGAPPGTRFTGTALLLSKVSEDPGYGLYSYVLLPHVPAPYEKERYRSLLIALLSISTAEDLSRLVPRSRINTTYLLTKKMPPPEVTSEADEANFLLQNYDYARAIVLLSTLPNHTGSGPVIVSVLSPLRYGVTPHPVLVQDLSYAQSDLMSLYVDAFCKRVAQDEFWQPQTLASLSLSLRNLLETSAVALGLSRTAVTSWIKLTR